MRIFRAVKSPFVIPLLLVGVACVSQGQNLNSATFFSPSLHTQHSHVALGALVDTAMVSRSTAPGTVTWTNAAGGYSGIGVAGVGGVHLSAYTDTTGNSLVFGRSLEVTGALNLLQGTLNTVLGTNLLSSWSATSNVTGLNIMAGQLYEATFDVSSGPGLPVGLLSSASFDVTSSGVTSFGEGSAGILNVLNVVSVGDVPSSKLGKLQFVSSTNRSDLQFQFLANSALSLGLLGGAQGNSNVLSFSNFQVKAIPEPSALMLSAVAVGGLLLRRKR